MWAQGSSNNTFPPSIWHMKTNSRLIVRLPFVIHCINSISVVPISTLHRSYVNKCIYNISVVLSQSCDKQYFNTIGYTYKTKYIYLHMFSEGLKSENIKQNSQNVYQMAIVQPGVGFICETEGGKVLLEETLSPHFSNMSNIFICILSVWGWNEQKLYRKLTKWISNGNYTTWNWLHMLDQWWYIIVLGSLTFTQLKYVRYIYLQLFSEELKWEKMKKHLQNV